MRIATIPAFNPGPLTGAGNNTYLLGDGTCVLIDAGVGDARHLDAIAAELDRLSARLDLVLVTHAHTDHIDGSPAIARRWPDARFAKIAWPDRDGALGIDWQLLRDRDQITSDGVTLEVVHTPGHAPDHACFWHAADRVVFAGDLVTPGTTVVIPGSRGGDLDAYLASLARVRALDPLTLLPGHGDPVTNVRGIIDSYVRHRRERDEQIMNALQNGASTVGEIVARVYPGLRQDLVWAAEESVIAHLIKLQRERRVVGRDGGWAAFRGEYGHG